MVCYFNLLQVTHLLCGLILLTAVGLTAVHIYRGSREEFTVVLLSFSLGFALSNIFGSFLIIACSAD
jgi:hypothetical protein